MISFNLLANLPGQRMHTPLFSLEIKADQMVQWLGLVGCRVYGQWLGKPAAVPEVPGSNPG